MSHSSQPLRCPPVLAARRRPLQRWVWLGLAGLFALLLGYYFFNPAEHSIFPTCHFYQLTGILCPGCGGQRALHCLLHGEVVRAFHQNALFIGALPLGGWLAVRLVQLWRTGRPLPAICNHQLAPWLVFLLVLSFGVLRNLPGFAWLRP